MEYEGFESGALMTQMQGEAKETDDEATETRAGIISYGRTRTLGYQFVFLRD